MTILEQIIYDIHKATIEQSVTKRDNLRLLLGEIQRSPKKLEADVDILKIIKSLKKNAETMLEHADGIKTIETIEFIDLLNSYLPQQLTVIEVEDWMRVNIDFNSLKNIKQAIGITMKHFGNTTDGKTVNIALDNIVK